MNEEDLKMLRYVVCDYDINSIDFEKHKRFVIERILRDGRPEHLKWLWTKYSDADIIEAVKSSSNLDKKTANFWAIHYNIPKEEIRCLNKQSLIPNLPF